MRPRTAGGRVFARSGQVTLGLWFVLPLVPVLLWAVARAWSYPDVLPSAWGPAGFVAALNDGAVPAYSTSMILGLLTAGLAVPAGAMAAHTLAFDPPSGGRAVTVLLLAPVFVPPFVVVMGLNVVLLRAHVPPLLGIAVILMVTAIPYTTFVMRTAYAGYDRTIEDEARTLGAGPRSVLVRIRIPLLAKPLIASALLAFLVGWSDYIVTLLVGGGQVVTVPLKVASAASGTGNDAVVAALSIAAVAPPLLLVVLVAAFSRTTRLVRSTRAVASAFPEPVPMKVAR